MQESMLYKINMGPKPSAGTLTGITNPTNVIADDVINEIVNKNSIAVPELTSVNEAIQTISDIGSNIGDLK